MATFDQLSQEVANIGGLEYAAESAKANAWAKAGLRHIARCAPWPWLRAQFSIALVADTYEYAFSTYLSDCFRLDTRSVRYGAGREARLRWRNDDFIDAFYGPGWKDSGGVAGNPEFVTRFGNALWVARKPSVAFIASNPTLYGKYWRTENYDGTLYLPDEFFECAVHAALAHGWAEEDDARAEQYKQLFKTQDLVEMMGATLDVGAEDRMQIPAWAHHPYEGINDLDDEASWGYGDSYGSY